MSEKYQSCSDEELIVRLRGGETEISDYLVERYKELVKQKARAMYLIGGDTDDLIQEGMIGLFKAVRDYSQEKAASFQTFARMCIDRQLYNAISNSNRQKHQPLNTYVSLSGEDEELVFDGLWAENPEAIVIDRENARDLERQIRDTLSPMENQVLGYYLRGYGYVQIGEILKKPPKSIDNALQRIRGKIRQCMEKAGEKQE